MNVDEVYTLMKIIVAKNAAQGYLSPAEFNRIINQAQSSYLDYLKGEYQRYQIKRPIAVVEFGQNQMIRQSLAPLVYETIIPVNSTTGIGMFPYAFEFADAMWGQYGFYNIRFVQQDRLSSYYRSVIDPITSNPVYLIKHEGFQFYPETIGNVRLSYIITPPTISWGYTLDVNQLPVYDPSTSSQPVWSNTDLLNIIVRALQIAGVSMQMAAVIQYSQEIKNTGQ